MQRQKHFYAIFANDKKTDLISEKFINCEFFFDNFESCCHMPTIRTIFSAST